MASLDAPGRLARLGAALVSTEPDNELQRIVTEAANLAAAPIALVSLVMGHVQFFRAAHGLPLDLQIACATSREDSFCQFVVRDEAPFVVTDAKHDPRLPLGLVQAYGIQAYLGVPIRLEGEVLGSLCVIDLVPRPFHADLVVSLERLAAQVSGRLAQLVRQRASRAALTSDEEPEVLLTRLEFHAALVDATLDELHPLLDQARAHGRSLAPLHFTALRPMLREATGLWPLLLSAVDEIEQAALQIQAALPEGRRLVVAAQAAERSLLEVAPLVRLGEAVLAREIDPATAARAGGVLSEALLFYRSMKDAIEDLRGAASAVKATIVSSRGAT